MTGNGIGFIGLGRMGGGMALNLLKSNSHLRVFDSSPPALARLADAGAATCNSAAELAAACDLLFVCLPAASHVRDILFGPAGVKGTAKTGLTIIDTTTLDRTDALAIAEDAAAAGLAYCDCPVSGMPFRADDGTLTVMFGGPKDIFGGVKPLLDCFGSTVVYCGPVSSGQAMKAVNNIIYNINITALCEVLPMAVAAGLDPEALATVTTTASSRSFASDYFVPRMMERRFDTDFTLAQAYKDIVNIQQMAIETRASLPVTNAMIASYQAAIAAGHGDEPKSAMLKVYERVLGIQFERILGIQFERDESR